MRAFLAFPLPEAVMADVARFQQRWRETVGTGAGVRWVGPDDLHITARFLGELEAEQVTEVSSVVSRHPLPTTEMALGVPLWLPRRRDPRVLALSVGCDPELVAWVRDLAVGVEALGFLPEARIYRPHITLARLGRGRVAATGLLSPPEPPSAAWCCDRLVLYRSHLFPEGSHYEPLREWSVVKN